MAGWRGAERTLSCRPPSQTRAHFVSLGLKIHKLLFCSCLHVVFAPHLPIAIWPNWRQVSETIHQVCVKFTLSIAFVYSAREYQTTCVPSLPHRCFFGWFNPADSANLLLQKALLIREAVIIPGGGPERPPGRPQPESGRHRAIGRGAGKALAARDADGGLLPGRRG